MAKVELRIPQRVESWHKAKRHTLASSMSLHGLELACERLMDLSRKPLQGNELESALEAYMELRDGVQEATESMEKVQLMLQVVGQNLMSGGYVQNDSS